MRLAPHPKTLLFFARLYTRHRRQPAPRRGVHGIPHQLGYPLQKCRPALRGYRAIAPKRIWLVAGTPLVV